MTPMLLSRVAQLTGGRLHGADVEVDTIVTDSRALAGGDRQAALFVALKGENFDGHDHVAAAASKGVRAALVSRALDVSLSQVVVGNTEHALAALAAGLQRERGAEVIAITGSNGKTGVKSLLLSILERAGRTYANPGNRNNEIGLPLAVIDAPHDAEYAIYEMGAGKPGDIAYLTAVAKPDVAVVNNIAPAHLERMGSLLGVADTKAAIYDALPADGVAVINADDAFAPYFAERAHGRRIIRFALESSADVSARDIHGDADGSRFTLTTPQGDVAITLPLPGRHNISNALAAASLALGLGVSLDIIAEGLNAARPVAGRLITYRLAQGVQLIDDSYNANPGSLNAAINLLGSSSGGEAWLVLGDMRELGADGQALHAEAGRRAKAAGITRLYALGALSAAAAEAFGEGGRVFDSHHALADALAADVHACVGGASAPTLVSSDNVEAEVPSANIRVLVKGSRGSAMDRIVARLLDAGEGAAHVH